MRTTANTSSEARGAEVVLAGPEITAGIHVVRGFKVMVDHDLAERYDVETKHLKCQVQRNILRFPKDFMFTLTSRELVVLKYQFGTSNESSTSERGGSRVLPVAFTEQGIAMLSDHIGEMLTPAQEVPRQRIGYKKDEL